MNPVRNSKVDKNIRQKAKKISNGVKSVVKRKFPWYAGGLHFECQQCGACCAGPESGYIWITKAEIKLAADCLKISPDELTRKYLKRTGFRTTITELPGTKNCIFLQESSTHTVDPLNAGGRRLCAIYPVRPNQCRTWPFWADNLTSPADWNRAAQKCPGVNRGRLYSLEEIEKIKHQKCWWKNADQPKSFNRP